MTDNVGLWRSTDHKYRWNNGPWMPGVTSVINVVDKPAIVPWAKGVTPDAALDNLDRLNDIVATDGRPPARGWLIGHADQERDVAAALGTRIHSLTEEIDRGGQPALSEIEAPFIDAYHRFLADWQPEFVSRERFVANLTAGYGGTFDFIAKIDGKMTLGDTKTGKAHYPEARLQLSGLAHGEFIGMPNDPKQYKMPEIEQAVILHVRPEAYERGYQLYRVDLNQSDWLAFLGALAVYRWTKMWPSKGEPMTRLVA